MDVNPEAASGLLPEGNTGERTNDGKGLDNAIAASMANFEETDVPFPAIQAKHKEEARKSKEPDAGDTNRTSEDALAAQATPEALKPDAALQPERNAQAFEAPKHWPEADRKAFAALPPENQTLIKRLAKDLEGGFTKKSQELSDTVKFAEAVRGSFDESSRQQMAQAGLDEVGTVRYLAKLQSYATQRPRDYIPWVMQQLGVRPEDIGLTQLRPQDAQQQHQPQRPSTGNAELDALLVDPEVTQLRTDFSQAQQQIAEMRAFLASQANAQQDAERNRELQHNQSLQKQWNEFRGAQDDSGQLAYPHADTLAQPMGALMDTHPVLRALPDGPDKLKKAYQMAVQADPELSKPLFESEVAKRLADAEKKREADRARKVSAVKPASGAPAVPRKKGGIDAAIDAAMASMGGD